MVSNAEVLSFIQKQPKGVGPYACRVLQQGFDKNKKLEDLKKNGSAAEKDSAEKQLIEMGPPKVWFWEAIRRKYPDYSDDDITMLITYALRAAR